jgi:hypothetical protein
MYTPRLAGVKPGPAAATAATSVHSTGCKGLLGTAPALFQSRKSVNKMPHPLGLARGRNGPHTGRTVLLSRRRGLTFSRVPDGATSIGAVVRRAGEDSKRSLSADPVLGAQ